MMFTQYFGLKSNPFIKEIEDSALFVSKDLRELSSRLELMKTTRGFFLLTSEPGCGKSVTVMDFYRGLILRMGEEPAYKKVMMFEQLQRLIQTSFYPESPVNLTRA